MDTVSVISAIAALVIGVEHLRYVEEHQLLRRSIAFLSTPLDDPTFFYSNLQ